MRFIIESALNALACVAVIALSLALQILPLSLAIYIAMRVF